MPETLNLNYYYGNEADQYSFYRIPKILLTDRRYKGVSLEAKVLYGLLLVFLLLVVFREQLLAALVGGGRNGGFVVAPLNDCDFTMRAWQVCALLSPGFRAKKEQDTFSDFLLGCAADGR